MSVKKISLIFMASISFVFAGNSHAQKVPACGDKQILGILNNMADLGYQRHNVDYRFEHRVTMIRTRKIERETGMRECAADFVVSNPKNKRSTTIPILYYVLLLDESKKSVVENENLTREISDMLFTGRLGR